MGKIKSINKERKREGGPRNRCARKKEAPQLASLDFSIFKYNSCESKTPIVLPG